jgi:MFS transporter, PAT family, beta-lactamase induction signal transducer AmpG
MFSRIFNFRMFVMLILGFSSGLPLALVGGTLMSWYAVSGVKMLNIGLLALITQPYFFKFLWAPALDLKLNSKILKTLNLDTRRSWIMLMQLGLMLGLVCMAFGNPKINPLLLASIGLIVAILSATQDVAIDAYRIEILPEAERGLGSAMQVEAYRLAMLFSGGIGLVIADHIGWQMMYVIMALSLVLPFIITYFAPSIVNIIDISQNKAKKSGNLSISLSINLFLDPIKAFWEKYNKKILAVILLIILYKLGDAFAGTMTNVFLLRHLNLSLSQVGMINKIVGLIASLIGILFGGLLLTKIKLFPALLIFGVLQMLTNIQLLGLCYGEPSLWQVGFTIFCENCAGGMGTSAFIVLLMSCCERKYAAGQYALLSALSAVGRIYLQPFAGWSIDSYGWDVFYFGSIVLCLPGLILLIFMRKSEVLSLSKESA